MTIVRMPFPPTVNNLFVNVGKRRVRSQRYATWARAAENEIMAQGVNPVPGDVELFMVAGRPDRRKRDISNLIKAPEDLLVSCGLIEDDSKVVAVSIRWDDSGDIKGLVASIAPAHTRSVEAA